MKRHDIRQLGSAKSGHREHKGIPGHRGGSLPGKGYPLERTGSSFTFTSTPRDHRGYTREVKWLFSKDRLGGQDLLILSGTDFKHDRHYSGSVPIGTSDRVDLVRSLLNSKPGLMPSMIYKDERFLDTIEKVLREYE